MCSVNSGSSVDYENLIITGLCNHDFNNMAMYIFYCYVKYIFSHKSKNNYTCIEKVLVSKNISVEILTVPPSIH